MEITRITNTVWNKNMGNGWDYRTLMKFGAILLVLLYMVFTCYLIGERIA